MNQNELKNFFEKNQAVMLEPYECPVCGSLMACAFMKRSDGSDYLQGVCIRCGHTRALPRYTMQIDANRRNKWSKGIREKYHERCFICGSDVQVEAHHIIPIEHDNTGVWWYNPRNGIALCRRCHELVHGEWMKKYRKGGEQ